MMIKISKKIKIIIVILGILLAVSSWFFKNQIRILFYEQQQKIASRQYVNARDQALAYDNEIIEKIHQGLAVKAELSYSYLILKTLSQTCNYDFDSKYDVIYNEYLNTKKYSEQFRMYIDLLPTQEQRDSTLRMLNASERYSQLDKKTGLTLYNMHFIANTEEFDQYCTGAGSKDSFEKELLIIAKHISLLQYVLDELEKIKT